MKTFEIPLFDNIDRKIVNASLVEGIPLDQIARANAQWTRIKQTYRSVCKQQGLPFPEHSHWNWENKAEYSALFDTIQTRFAIVCRNEIQGLMLVERLTQFAKLPPDKGEPILYVKYLEVAPQNIAPYADPRRFLGVGRAFLRSAIDFSVSEGYQGRVGLHALPQAEAFYRANAMTELGDDLDHENLRYFEWTSAQAKEYQERR